MNKKMRLSNAILIVILVMILIFACLSNPALNLFLIFIPVPFAIIGTLSDVKNTIILSIITFISLIVLVEPINGVDIFINSIIPGIIIGIVTKKVLLNKESNKYEPIFVGCIVFLLSIIVHYFISKYIFSVDLIDELLNIFNQNIEAQKSILQTINNSGFMDTVNISDVFRNIIPTILFFRSIILSIIVYLTEIFILRRFKSDNMREIRFRNFYLPGNAILISFMMYLFMMILSTMKTPLYTDVIFFNIQMAFNFLFIIQGISVCIYFIKQWMRQRVSFKIILGIFSVGIFGVMGISFIGMLDSILDFRRVRVCKSV